ncbi:MAG: PDDEXK nuclease domain-containing protein [Bacilli bacterium]|nr:PDDEXK nuclease domain-containing protein [Bacilli bacterium]
MLKKNNSMVLEISTVVNEVKSNLAKEINKSITYVYWNIGRIIVKHEIEDNNRLEYGKEVLKELSLELTKILGKGYSLTNLTYMRWFYNVYPDYSMINESLSWSHYVELITIKDEEKRKFYEKESINSNWSVRELKRQLETSLFERLLLSDGKNNKKKVLELSKEGQVVNKPSDIIKQPYVFEFLGIKEQKPLLEKDLEYKLIRHIEDFLLELGKGFMFVGSQQRITLNNTDYYVDMVFYNKYLKSYVLIDLKMNKLKAENLGQMNMYLNYYEKVVNSDDDGKPIGIILCAEKDKIALEFALGGLSNNIFASTYTYYIPNKEQLISEVEKVLNETEKDF